jgi:heme exporter protein CcmD
MNGQGWMELMQFGSYALHVWGSYLAVPAVMLIELVLLLLRRREILGHLGWRDDELKGV